MTNREIMQIACNLVSYGNNIVASVREEYRSIVTEYIGKFTFYHCFETPNMHWLNDRLSELGQRVCFMADTICRMLRNYVSCRAAMSRGFWNHWSFPVCICRSGAMPYVRTERNGMFSAWSNIQSVCNAVNNGNVRP